MGKCMCASLAHCRYIERDKGFGTVEMQGDHVVNETGLLVDQRVWMLRLPRST
jgi:hypothetical protein